MEHFSTLLGFVFTRFTCLGGGRLAKPKGINLKEQVLKLEIIAKAQGWTKNIHWENPLGIGSSTLSNWRSGSRIAFEKIDLLAVLLQIDRAILIDSAAIELANILKVEFSNVEGYEKEPKFFSHTSLSTSDREILENLKGDFVGFFIAREGREMKIEYLAVEKFRIGRTNFSTNSISFEQLKNQMVGEAAFGSISVINERAVAYVTYQEYYPPSLYYFAPFFINGYCILVGVYSDITVIPDKEVFSMKCVLFPDSPVFEGIGERMYDGDKNFSTIFELLDKGLGAHRKRLVVEPTRAIYNELDTTWKNLVEMPPRDS